MKTLQSTKEGKPEEQRRKILRVGEGFYPWGSHMLLGRLQLQPLRSQSRRKFKALKKNRRKDKEETQVGEYLKQKDDRGGDGGGLRSLPGG